MKYFFTFVSKHSHHFGEKESHDSLTGGRFSGEKRLKATNFSIYQQLTDRQPQFKYLKPVSISYLR